MSTAAEVQKAIEESNAATAAIVEVSASAVHALEGVTKRIEEAVAAFASAHPDVDVSALVASTAAEKTATAAIAAAIVAGTPAAAPAPAAPPPAAPAATDPTPAPTT